MKRVQQFTAIIERESDGYVSLCPELDIASQGDSVEEAKNNLVEALQLFFKETEEEALDNIREAIALYLEPDPKALY